MNLSQSQKHIHNFRLVYSPRTTYDTEKSKENYLYKDLLQSFDPYTLNTLRRHFKEHLGSITKDIFICILKRHLLSWHLNIKNRQVIIIKLLSKLFDEIDLDSDDKISWNEFSNYLVYIGGSRKAEDSIYYLRKYFQCKKNFDHVEKSLIDDERINYMVKTGNIVSYCFYIAKYRVLGLIHEGKTKILFFNCETLQKLKIEIDLSWIQNEIDKYEIFDFEYKTEVMLQRQQKEKLKNRLKIEEENRNYLLKSNSRYKSSLRNKLNNLISKDNHFTLYDMQKKNSINKIINNKKRVSTPSTVKKESIIQSINLRKKINKLNNESKTIESR